MNNQPIAYIDTNIFLRFLIKDPTNPHLNLRAKDIISQINQGQITAHTNICIVSELVYVLEGYYQLSKAEVVEKIAPLISLDSIIIEHKATVLAALTTYQDHNIDLEDAYTYHLMQEAQIDSIYTFDQKHFKRLPAIHIIK